MKRLERVFAGLAFELPERTLELVDLALLALPEVDHHPAERLEELDELIALAERRRDSPSGLPPRL